MPGGEELQPKPVRLVKGRNGNIVDQFIRYTEGRGSPVLYRKWSGIFITGALLERKCWVRTTKGKLFPNQYILLVGPAGVGKSLCTSAAFEFLDEVRTPETPFHIAPTSVTKASLIDALEEAERRIVRPLETPAVVSFNSLTIIANEFGVFLPSWEAEFMSTLTDLWDCGRYAETRRTSKLNIMLPNTQLNMLSADTPTHLNNLLPEGAWEQGFMSRTLIVYSGEMVHTDLFSFNGTDLGLHADILSDLQSVYRMYGEFEVVDEVKLAINEWSQKGCPPVPDHPKLISYRIRRLQHLLKLCMVASAAGDSDRIITLDHYAEALDWLLELEAYIPDVFKAMRSGGDGRVIEEAWHYAYSIWIKNKEPVPEHRLVAFLQERTPVYNITRMLDVMVQAKLLTKKFTGSGGIGYEPKQRKS